MKDRPIIERGLATLIITGSSGRIGSSFIDRVGATYTEMGFDREGPPHPPPETEHVIACDLGSDGSVRAALDEVRRLGHKRIASMIHLAAYYSFSGEPGERINEDWPLEPKWDYPKSKVATEHLILRERGDVPVVFLRIAGVYDDRCHSIPIAQQIKRIYENSFLSRVYSGDITHGAAFVHMEDMVEALVLAVEHRQDLPSVTTLLIGEPETLSYDALQRAISRQLHVGTGVNRLDASLEESFHDARLSQTEHVQWLIRNC